MFKKNIVNRIIRTLIISDFFLLFAIGLLAPILAVFILENIENRIEVVGYAVSCFWVTRLLLVIPISRLMDKIKGETDEYSFLVGGTFLISLVPLFYIIASEPWHVYVIQILNGLAYSMAVPAWRIVFTNNVDRNIVGFEWSLEDVGVGIATAASASIGALIASHYGFNVLFVLMFLSIFISALILLTLFRNKRSLIRKIFGNRSNKAPVKIDGIK